MNRSVICVKDLSFSYDKLPTLEKINFTISQGECIGIFGPNGGGKTTLLLLLMSFLKPSKGKITVFETSPKAARSKIGYVPQFAHYDKLFPLSVFDLVLMGCLRELKWWGSYPKEANEKAEESLAKVSLLEFKNKPFGALSGGQMQRALIARALASDPQLLLLDEPTASVDPDAEEEVGNLLLNLKGTMTLLIVTHNLQAMGQKADRWLCVNRNVQSLRPEEVCSHFALGLYHPPLKERR